MKVMLTGAMGNLGAKLRSHLRDRCELVLTDLRTNGDPEVIAADLSRFEESWVKLFAGCDVVVHLAGDPVAYHSWEEITEPNVDAVLNVFAAAARHGVRRVVFASSNHVMGGYQEGSPVPITPDMPPRPGLFYTADGAERFSGPYGAAKWFGERIGKHYSDVHGIECIAVRIGWVWRGRNDPRALPAERGDWFRMMWLSDRDFLHLMDGCLAAELPARFVVVNGMSANTGMRWDLSVTRAILGYEPKDDVTRVD